MGSNLDALPTAQLQQLVHAQEEALKRARSMLVSKACATCTWLHSQNALLCHKQSGHCLQVRCVIMRLAAFSSSQFAALRLSGHPEGALVLHWCLYQASVFVSLLYCALSQCQLCRLAGTLRKVQQLLPQQQRML